MIVEKRLLIIVFTMLIVGCASINPEHYRAPDSTAGYAKIKDQPLIEYSFPDEFVRILSIDRKRVDSKSRGTLKSVASDHNDLEKAIVLAVGVRRLRVEACKSYPSIFVIIKASLHVSQYRCASAVLRLEARLGFQYLVRATVNNNGDYADFWIESIESGDKATEPVRVTGLYDL